MSISDLAESDAFSRELIWLLYQRTDLTQEQIAELPSVSASQTTVSRTLSDYDPAFDGFEFGTEGFPDDDELQEDALDDYREAVADVMEHSFLSTFLTKAVMESEHIDADEWLEERSG